MNAQLLTDRDGDLWEVVADALRDTETGQLLSREQVEAFFGPLTDTDTDD